MPRIKVNEQDLSWYYAQRTPGVLGVTMFGVSSWGPFYEPILVNTDNFEYRLGQEVTGKADITYSYQTAKSFNKAGCDVYFIRCSCGSEVAASSVVNATYDAYVKVTLTGTVPDDGTQYYVLTDGAYVEVAAGTAVDDSKEYYKIEATSVPLFTITAKYKGSYGSKIGISGSCKIDSEGNLTSTNLQVSANTGAGLLETCQVDFFDATSPKYYEMFNMNSNYIEVEPEETIPAELAGKLISIKIAALGKDTGGTAGSDGNGELADYLGSLVANSVASDGTLTRTGVLSLIRDKLSYDYDVIYNPFENSTDLELVTYEDEEPVGFNESSDIYKLMMALWGVADPAKGGRGDIIVLTSGTPDLEGSVENLGYDESGALIVTPAAGLVGYAMLFDTSYVACYAPYTFATLVSNGSIVRLPATYALIVSWAQSIGRGNPKYLAPAGVKRTSLGGLVQNTIYKVTSDILDLWQNHEIITDSVCNINPVMLLKQYGYVIYGNSTLLHYKGHYPNVGTSLLNQFSVRVICNEIKRYAFNVSLSLAFDQMGDGIFAEFKTLMTEFMDNLKYNDALFDYEITLKSNLLTYDNMNQRRVPICIRISPTPAAENFDIDLEISPAGITFSDELSQGMIEAVNLGPVNS